MPWSYSFLLISVHPHGGRGELKPVAFASRKVRSRISSTSHRGVGNKIKTFSLAMAARPFSASGEHRRTFLEKSVAPFDRIGAEADLRLRFDLAAKLIGI